MKKLCSICVVAVLCVFTAMEVNAQKSKSFAGTVKFAIKYEGDTDPQTHQPGEYICTVFGNKQKTSNQWYQQIVDGDAVTITVLLDIPGNRMGYTQKKESIEEQFSAVKLTYTKSEETKTICGYVCTRYDITVLDVEEDEESKVIVYTTTEIGSGNNINSTTLPGLTGFPLYIEQESEGVKSIQEAIEVKKAKIKSVDFMVPSDYTIYDTQEEFQEKLQELMGSGGEE
ncbi:MAG: DUF4412 domain-containing protein [Bacteroidales bacterium]|jgi:hypothetical protein|nr:DUF4412 domain-containing protein [Bacteroidales bacterium]